MNDRLSWWVIPGALVVLARVVTLGGAGEATAGDVAVQDAAVAAGAVVLQDATGRRSAPVAWSSLTATALVVVLPDGFAGQRGTMTVWRRLAGGREAEPWLRFDATVRADGTFPIAGLATGRYDLQLAFGAGEAVRTFATADAGVPGEWAIADAAPVR